MLVLKKEMEERPYQIDAFADGSCSLQRWEPSRQIVWGGGGLLHREGAPEHNVPAPALVFTLGTDRMVPFFDLKEL